jgi:adenylate cyclase
MKSLTTKSTKNAQSAQSQNNIEFFFANFAQTFVSCPPELAEGCGYCFFFFNFTIKMATETERKFLVKGEFRHLSVRNIEMIQTYLTIDPEKTIRLRIADDKAYLTVKSRPALNTITRNEWEVEIPVADVRQMMNICLPGRIIKTRYLVPAGKHTYEVDVFHDKNEGLVVAEIELQSDDEQFDKPGWLGEEVTGLPQYYNANLIK